MFAGITKTYSQVTHAKYTEFKQIKKRPLLVVVHEVNQKYIDKLNKKIAKSKRAKRIEKWKKEIEDEKNAVNDYNTLIKEMVPKYLNYHPKVIYMTAKEFNKNYKKLKRERKYTVLWLSNSKRTFENNHGFLEETKLGIPTINYSRIEKGKIKVDYSFYIPYFGKDYGKLNKTNMDLTFRLMQQHIDYIVKNKKKKYAFVKKYATEQAKKNCKKLAGKDLYIAKEMLDKKTKPSVLSTNYKHGKVHVISEKELRKIIDNKEDKAVAVLFPYAIARSSIGVGITITKTGIMNAKIILNPSDGTIYLIRGVKSGEFFDGKFRPREFKKYGKCKK